MPGGSAHHTGVPIIHSRTSNLHIVVWWDTWTLTPARYTAAGRPGTQETLTLPTIQSVLANHAWMCKILIIFLLPSYDCLATQ